MKTINTTRLLLISAIAAAVVTPGWTQTNNYLAKRADTKTGTTFSAAGLDWSCKGPRCTASSADRTDMIGKCGALAKQAGPLLRFRMNTKSLGGRGLNKCNAHAKPKAKAEPAPNADMLETPTIAPIKTQPTANKGLPKPADKEPAERPPADKAQAQAQPPAQGQQKSLARGPAKKVPANQTQDGADMVTQTNSGPNMPPDAVAVTRPPQFNNKEVVDIKFGQMKAAFLRDQFTIENLNRHRWEETRRRAEAERARREEAAERRRYNASRSTNDTSRHANLDCDDSRADVFPGASETCDHRDNNCNGEIDEGVSYRIFLDADGDGAGDPDNAISDVCPADEERISRESGYQYSHYPIDCDDTDPEKHNAATCREEPAAPSDGE